MSKTFAIMSNTGKFFTGANFRLETPKTEKAVKFDSWKSANSVLRAIKGGTHEIEGVALPSEKGLKTWESAAVVYIRKKDGAPVRLRPAKGEPVAA